MSMQLTELDKYQQFLQSKLVKNQVSGFNPNYNLIPTQAFQFQKDMIRWATNKGKAGLYVGTGSGKTLMELAYGKQLSEKENKEAIILLAPLGVTPQTVREGKKFDIEVNLCESQDNVKKGINITNYEKLHKFNTNNFIGVIADESSILKDYTGATSNELIERFRQTPYRLAASATPSPNDYMEIGTQAEFLGIMSRVEMLAMFFVHDGGETSKWRLKGHAEQAFWQWVSTWACFMTHPRDLNYEEKGFDLPPLNIKEIVLEVECKDILFPVGKLTLEQRRNAKKDSIDDRIEACANLINKSDETWLVWCSLNEEGDKLEKLINSSKQIAGRHTSEYKEQTMIDFADNKIKCLITKLQIAGKGMNWQNCHNMAFVGLGDSFEYYYQGIRRCWRFGQTEQVNVYVITSSAEGAIVDNIKRKEKDYEKMTQEITKYTKEYVREELSQTTHQKNEYKTDTIESHSFKLMLGDSCERIKELKDQSVDYSIYSPPFSSLYVYSNSERDMGNSKSYEEFTQHFNFLAKELFRIIKDGRLMSVHCMNLPTTKQHSGYIGIQDFRGDLIRLFQSVGFIYHSEVCIWKDPVTAMQRTKALGLLYKQLRKDSTMSRQGIPDYLVTFRKPGENKEPVTKTHESFSVDLWQRYASPVWFDINPSNTLQKESAREAKDERHIAPLQLQVIERAIQLWSNPGELIFSPFAGIGSEIYQAVKMKRKGLGIELKQSYYKQAVLNCKRAEIEANSGTLWDLMGDDQGETFGEQEEIEQLESGISSIINETNAHLTDEETFLPCCNNVNCRDLKINFYNFLAKYLESYHFSETQKQWYQNHHYLINEQPSEHLQNNTLELNSNNQIQPESNISEVKSFTSDNQEIIGQYSKQSPELQVKNEVKKERKPRTKKENTSVSNTSNNLFNDLATDELPY